jgi:hypothetical protein
MKGLLRTVLVLAVSVLSIQPTHAGQPDIIASYAALGQVQPQSDLTFTVPVGWVRDERSAKKNGLFAALVPAGTSMDNADAVITISFDKKDPNTEGLENLKSYFAYDMRQTIAQAPGAKFARWQPSRLEPAKINFMSIEIYGSVRNQPAPQHLIIVDSGDGFYSIAVTVRTRDDLKLGIYDEFFNGLALTPRS